MRLTSDDARDVPQGLPALPAGALSSAAALGVGLLAVFLLDQATGSAPVQHLYYAPIVLAAVRLGFRGGLAASFAAIVLYHLANPRLMALQHQQWDFVQVLLFVAVGIVTARLTDDNRRLQTLASTDDLTGLHNLRSFEDQLAAIVRSCREARLPLTLLVLDVDRLKALNDTHGHRTGAEAVRTVGHAIAAQLPSDAVACRYGGDEFVIALPRCTESGGRAFADAVRRAVYEAAPVLAGVPFPARTLSVSVGVASASFASRGTPLEDGDQGEALFRVADRALYRAKELGRNHVCVA